MFGRIPSVIGMRYIIETQSLNINISVMNFYNENIFIFYILGRGVYKMYCIENKEHIFNFFKCHV